MRMYIDDIRDPKNDFDWIARSSEVAIDIMKWHGCPSYISFDHDLGGEDTSMVIIKWMVIQDLDSPGWIPNDFSFNVHSANPVGAANIEGYLNSYFMSKEAKSKNKIESNK